MDNEPLLRLGMALKATDYSFTTVTPATHARVNSRLKNGWARNVKDVFGWSRPFMESVISPELFEVMDNAGVLERYGEGWISRVRASTLHSQLFFHSAYPTTAPDAIFFGPDTHLLANAIARYLSGDVRVNRAVDIGCGAGAGAVVIALERPDAEVFAVDINNNALEYTSVNAGLAGVTGVVARHSDLLDGVEGNFDLIVSNPPFLIDAQERTYRHGGGSLGEGLALSIVSLAKKRLAPGGALVLYMGSAIIDGEDPFLASVAPILDDSSLEWDYQEIHPDVFGEELDQPAYAQADRIAAVILTARR